MSNKEHSTHCTIIASATHLFVDCLCVCALYLLSAVHSREDIITALLTYNVIAFCSQPLTGIVADRMSDRKILLHASMILLATAVIITDFCPLHHAAPLATAIVLGVGNSLFHVWGGKETALASNNDIVSLGIFVAPGAMGLSIGYLFHSQQLLYASIAAVMLLSAAYTHMNNTHDSTSRQTVAKENPKEYSLTFTLSAMAAITAIVVMRSFAGEEFSAATVKSDALIFIIGAMSTIGKIAGGIMTKQMGLKGTIAILLAATALCYPLRHTGICAVLCGLFFINCTMPITLYFANKILKGKEGLAFGILAAALIPGYLIATL